MLPGENDPVDPVDRDPTDDQNPRDDSDRGYGPPKKTLGERWGFWRIVAILCLASALIITIMVMKAQIDLWKKERASNGQAAQPSQSNTPAKSEPKSDQKTGQSMSGSAAANTASNGVRAEQRYQVLESQQREFWNSGYLQGADDQAKKEGVRVWTTQDAERIFKEQLAKMRAKVMNDP